MESRFRDRGLPGGAVGALTGPFLRATVLANPDTFRATLGVALALFGFQLCWKAAHDYAKHGRSVGRDFLVESNSSSMRFEIETTAKSWRSIAIRFGQHHRTLPNLQLFAIGAGVGLIFVCSWSRRRVSSGSHFCNGLSVADLRDGGSDDPLYNYLVTCRHSHISVVLPAFGTPSIGPEWSWISPRPEVCLAHGPPRKLNFMCPSIY